MSSCVESGLEGRHVYSSLMVFDKRFFYVASFLGHEISPTDPLKFLRYSQTTAFLKAACNFPIYNELKINLFYMIQYIEIITTSLN